MTSHVIVLWHYETLHFPWYYIVIILICNIWRFLLSWNYRAFTFHIKLHLNVIFDNRQKRNHMHSPYIYPFDFDILLYLCFILWSTALTPIPFFVLFSSKNCYTTRWKEYILCISAARKSTLDPWWNETYCAWQLGIVIQCFRTDISTHLKTEKRSIKITLYYNHQPIKTT